MTATYCTVPAVNTVCSKCHQQPRLLCPLELCAKGPAFYVCACGDIGQVGVGPVTAFTDDVNRDASAYRAREARRDATHAKRPTFEAIEYDIEEALDRFADGIRDEIERAIDSAKDDLRGDLAEALEDTE